jgi:hypothetical protein
VGAPAPPIVGLVRPLHKKRRIVGAIGEDVKEDGGQVSLATLLAKWQGYRRVSNARACSEDLTPLSCILPRLPRLGRLGGLSTAAENLAENEGLR